MKFSVKRAAWNFESFLLGTSGDGGGEGFGS